MKRRCSITLVVVAVLGGILQITGCSSPRTRHKWLALFFDGVPAETSARPAAAPPVTQAAVLVAAPPVPKPPLEVLHQPFEQQKCGACHDRSTVSTNAKLPLLQLCFNCHENFLTGPKVKHQPVANGDCLECHAPHKSPNKNLLLQKGDALCLTCHDDPLAAGPVKHQALGVGGCLECHDPHASDQKALVKQSVPALCWTCHEDFREKAKFQHFGVDDCTSCHKPHASGEKKLLVLDVLKLCGECHEDKDLNKVKGHAGKAGMACTICHDPHVGQNANLLKPAALPK